MHLERDSRHQGLTRLLVHAGATQGEPKDITVNDLVWRAMTRAGIPSVKEPNGLTRSDGKRPDGFDLDSLAWGPQRHLGCYRDKHRLSFIPGHVISSRRISRRSCSHPQRRQIHRNILGTSLLSGEIMAPSIKLVKISCQSWDVGFLHLLATHGKPFSCSNVCPSLCSVSMLFHLHSRSASHNLKQLTYRSTLKHIIEFNLLTQFFLISPPLGTEYQGH